MLLDLCQKLRAEGVALYKHDENGHKSIQGFVDPKTSMEKHFESAPQKNKADSSCETNPHCATQVK